MRRVGNHQFGFAAPRAPALSPGETGYLAQDNRRVFCLFPTGYAKRMGEATITKAFGARGSKKTSNPVPKHDETSLPLAAGFGYRSLLLPNVESSFMGWRGAQSPAIGIARMRSIAGGFPMGLFDA